MAIARLVTALRDDYPGADIGALYANATLQDMYEYTQSLGSAGEKRPEPKPIPKTAGVIQGLTIAGLYGYNAARYIVGILAVVAVLYTIFDAGWVPQVPLLPVIVGWFVLFSVPGRILIAAGLIRALNRGLQPGEYLRGGAVHMRVWAAQRILEHLKFDKVYGTPMAVTLHRALGTKVGEECLLSHAPSVTGLARFGNHVSIESEADMNGYWVDGDKFILGSVHVDDGARIGERCIAMPNAHVRAGSEIISGSRISGTIPANETWGGSPIVREGTADQTWPNAIPEHTETVETWSPLRNFLSYQLALGWLTIMPVLALLPGTLLVTAPVISKQWYDEVFPHFALWLPVFILLTVATWLTLIILTVRVASVFVRPGYFAEKSSTGLALWVIHAALQRTLISTYFIYASFFTPTFMRLLGAKVGRNVEISTVETIPHLTVFKDGSFMADHSLVSSTRHKNGWVHVGSSVIGEKSFVGNSAIIGPDRDLPADSLVAVLSSLPPRPAIGTSWLGRTSEPIPRAKVEADDAATYAPPLHLQIGRVLVELCRLIPAIIAGYIDLAIVWVLTWVYIEFGMGVDGLIAASLAAYPVVLLAGAFATLLPVALKWVLIGRFKAVDKPLFCDFVWCGELFDVFCESLAIPSFIRMSLGSPFFNAWARMMGVKVGKNVFCETWWLPEFDLITLEDGVSINRGTVLQTHLFHDRVMSMERVTFKAGSTLGPNSFVLPGATVGERTTVFPGSLVMRQETLPGDSIWSGNPVRHIAEVTEADNSLAFAEMISDPKLNAPSNDSVSVLNLTAEGARWETADR